MKEIFKLIQQMTGKKLSRNSQVHWAHTINKMIDQRIKLIRQYSESSEMLSFDDWLQLQEATSNYE